MGRPAGLPEHRVHGDRREARHGVDLVDDEGVGTDQEEVNPGQALDPQGHEGPPAPGPGPWPAGRQGQVHGHDGLGHAQQVLVLEVVELAAGHDLPGGRDPHRPRCPARPARARGHRRTARGSRSRRTRRPGRRRLAARPASCTLLTPMDDPRLAGLTKSGRPSRPAAAASPSSPWSARVTSCQGATGIWWSCSTDLAMPLSMQMAEDSTPAPT